MSSRAWSPGSIFRWIHQHGCPLVFVCCTLSTTRPHGFWNEVSTLPGLSPVCPRRYTLTMGPTSAVVLSFGHAVTRDPDCVAHPEPAALRWAYRATDRHADGCRPSIAGHDLQQSSRRGDYRSAKSARMTIRELERWIGWEICGHYHQRIHAGLHRPPIAVWQEHEERIALRMPLDRLKFWVSFLPEDQRTLRRDGIHFCNIRYWSDALAADLGRTKGKLLVKYDPRDLSRIFVRRASGRFVEARYRNLGWPAITLWEQKAAVRYLKGRGRSEIDEALIFKTTIRQREIEDEAVERRRRRVVVENSVQHHVRATSILAHCAASIRAPR